MKFFKKKISKINNRNIYSITLINNNNYRITFLTFGGYIHEVSIPYFKEKNKFEDVILSYKNYKDCYKDTSYFNSIIGRVGNRISNSKFKLKNKVYNLSKNIGSNHLHGGIKGFNKKIWTLKKIKKNKNYISCKLQYFSKNLEEGYPGNLKIDVEYIFNNKNEFQIIHEATSDKDTIINLTNHNYWNFHGHKKFYQNIKDHSVKIYSKKICENNKALIPTGNLIKVKNTKYDFINHRVISKDFLKNGGIDNNYEVNAKKSLKKVAEVFSLLTKMGVIYYTDLPGMQFYTGNMMKKKYNGKNNKKYGLNYGLCLEPQFFPDSINQPNFKDPILKKGKKHKSSIIMKLYNNFN